MSKLAKVMSCVLSTKDKVLTISANYSQNLHWHIDTAFGVYLGMRSHYNGMFSMGFGSTSSSPTKQKVSSRSSTEEELIDVDDYYCHS